MIRRGELDHVRLGRLVKIPRHAIARFLGEPEGPSAA
jgi:excisionase family DNA binding protein